MNQQDSADRRRVLNRLRRARGQLDAVIGAVEDDAPCRDILTQLTAANHALDRAAFLIVATAMEDCVDNPEAARDRDGLDLEELEKLFLSLA